MKVNITKNEFQTRKDDPNRVFHSYEGNIGDYTFTAETDSNGTDGINKGSIYKLDIYNKNSSVGRYDRKWEYRSKNTKDGAIRSTIIKYIDSISDKKDGEPKMFSKGGKVIEKRYVNKSEDYETRYAKDKPMRKGYKDERMFKEGGETGKKLKGYRVYVFESSLSSSSNALKGDSYVLVTDGIQGDSSQVDSDEVYLKLVKRHIFGKDILHAEPVNINRGGNQMFGGKFVWSTDSRFRNDISEQPIQLHDRFESYAVGGEVGNQVSFKGDYGTPRSGIVKEKRGSSYIVATDDGDRLVDSYEVISFSDAPIEKKKRFGFFAKGGWVLYDQDDERLIKVYETESEARKNLNEYGGNANIVEKSVWEGEKFEGGGKIDNWMNAEAGDSARVISENKMGLIIKDYGRKFHLKFVDGSEKTYDASELEFYKFEDEDDNYEGGGEIQSKIDKLNKVVNSKMLPEGVKDKARKQIAELEKELHESKETKAEEKAEDENDNYLELKGKSINVFYMGEENPETKIITSAKVSPARFSNRNVTIGTKNGTVSVFPLKKIDSFMNGEEVEIKGGKESYIIELTKAEEKAEHKKGGSEARLDEKEELNATIQKLYGIESKAEDLINYQDGGIQSQSVDKIKKYVEYINKEVSKLNVPFGSEVYGILQDENAHSLNLTLGLLGFYKNEKDNGSWARTRTSYKDLVNTVNEIKGIKTEYKVGDPIKKPTTRKAEIITDKADVQKIKNSIQEGESILKSGKINGRKLSEGELESTLNSVNKSRAKIGLPKSEAKAPKFKIGDVVGLDLDEATPKMITSFKTNRKGEIIYSGYYIPFPDQKWNYEESEIVLLKAPSKPTTRKAPIKKAVAKKEPKPKFKVGETVSIIDHPKSDKTNFYKVVGHQDWNDNYGWETTIEKADEKVTMFENLLEKSVTPKTEVKKDLPKIKVGDTIKVYATNGDLIIDEVFKNDKGEVSYRGKYIANDNLKSYHSSKKTYEYILNEQDTIVKPKADHKKLVAKLKAKKGAKEYDNRASLNTETGERRKRSESSDKKREALPLGKRVSASGNKYYENRLNRGDVSKEDKFEEGGEVKSSGWGLKFLKW